MADVEEESITARYSDNRSRWQKDASKFTPRGILPLDRMPAMTPTRPNELLSAKERPVEVEENSIILNYHTNRTRWQNDSSKFTPKGILPRDPSPVIRKLNTSNSIGMSASVDFDEDRSISSYNSYRSRHSTTRAVQQNADSSAALVESLDVVPQYSFYGEFFEPAYEPEQSLHDAAAIEERPRTDEIKQSNLKASDELKAAVRQLSLGSLNVDEEREWNKQTLLKQQQAAKAAADEWSANDRQRIFSERTEEKNRLNSNSSKGSKAASIRVSRMMDENDMAKENLLENSFYGNRKLFNEQITHDNISQAPTKEITEQTRQFSPARNSVGGDDTVEITTHDGEENAPQQSPSIMDVMKEQQQKAALPKSPLKPLGKQVAVASLESPSRMVTDQHAVERVELAIQERLAARKARKDRPLAQEEKYIPAVSAIDQHVRLEPSQNNSSMDQERWEQGHHSDDSFYMPTSKTSKSSPKSEYLHISRSSDDEPFDITASDFNGNVLPGDFDFDRQDKDAPFARTVPDSNDFYEEFNEYDLPSDLNNATEEPDDYDFALMKITSEAYSGSNCDEDDDDFAKEMSLLATSSQHENQQSSYSEVVKETAVNTLDDKESKSQFNNLWDAKSGNKSNVIVCDDASTVSSVTRLSFDEGPNSQSQVLSSEFCLPSNTKFHDNERLLEETLMQPTIHFPPPIYDKTQPPILESKNQSCESPLGQHDKTNSTIEARPSTLPEEGMIFRSNRRLKFVGRNRNGISVVEPFEKSEKIDKGIGHFEQRTTSRSKMATAERETDDLAKSIAASASKITPAECITMKEDTEEKICTKIIAVETMKSDLTDAPLDELKCLREAANRDVIDLDCLEEEEEVTATKCIDEMRQFWDWAAALAGVPNEIRENKSSSVHHGSGKSAVDRLIAIGGSPELDSPTPKPWLDELKRVKAANEALQRDAAETLVDKPVHRTSKQQAISKEVSAKPNIIILSGCILARTSLKTIVMKKWKESFWIQYEATLMLFRSIEDFKEWKTHQYTPTLEIPRGKNSSHQESLVKFRIDFKDEMLRPGVRGFRTTEVKSKTYTKGGPLIYNFKLEKWMDLGPSILAVFASESPEEIEFLRHAIDECLQKCPDNGLRSIKDLLVDDTGKKTPF